jgi:hypothetical protein
MAIMCQNKYYNSTPRVSIGCRLGVEQVSHIDSGWATDKEFDKMKLARPVNEGWLYSKDDKSVKLFASYDKDDDGITFGDRTMIPRAWVKKIQKL